MTAFANSSSPTARQLPRSPLRKHRLWLRGLAIGLLAAILLVLVFGNRVHAASATNFAGGYFELLSANEKSAHFSILEPGRCTRLDLHCSVQVTIRNGTIPNPDRKAPTAVWTEILEACAEPTSAHENHRNAAFHACWDNQYRLYDLVWPNFVLIPRFEISPHCEPGDDECAEQFHFCYNAADCASVLFRSSEWTRVSDVWQAVDDCFYSDDWSRMWECADVALWYWFAAHVPRASAYRTMDLVRKDLRGFILLDYADSISDVADADSAARTNAEVLDQYLADWERRAPRSMFRSMPDIERGGPRFRPPGGHYLTVDFTGYLESSSAEPIQICDTALGCLNAEVDSGAFSAYMHNLHILIEDSHVLNCMARQGWNVGSATAVAFDNPMLARCDERIRTAVRYCPAPNTGLLRELVVLWDLGLFRGLVADPLAHTVRQIVEEARDRTPECLCAAGFQELNFVVAEHASADPWAATGALQTKEVCE